MFFGFGKKKIPVKDPQALRVGVVGVGHLGQHHARIYNELPQSVLVGVADTSLDRAKAISAKVGGGCFATADYRELLGKVDAVSIVTPTSSHYDVAKVFLEQKIPVLLEKPMTQTAREAEDLMGLSRRLKILLQIGHIERFNAAVGMLNQLKQKPRFIESLRQGPFDGRVKDVGVVQDLMIHDLDIILELLGHSPVTGMEAVGVNVITPFEDIANVRLHFQNGCVANVTASRISTDRVRKIRVFQQNSYLSIDYMNQKVTMLRLKEGMTLGVSNFKEAIIREEVPIQPKEPLRMELLSFLQCVREKLEPVVPPEHGYAALKLALDITEEIRKNMGKIKG